MLLLQPPVRTRCQVPQLANLKPLYRRSLFHSHIFHTILIPWRPLRLARSATVIHFEPIPFIHDAELESGRRSDDKARKIAKQLDVVTDNGAFPLCESAVRLREACKLAV